MNTEHGTLHLIPVRDKNEFLVTNVSVPTGQRDQGHGTAMMQHLTERASAHGTALAIHVSPKNPRAEKVYRKVGFTDAEPTPEYQSPIFEGYKFLRREP